jgi:hypothetical protein
MLKKSFTVITVILAGWFAPVSLIPALAQPTNKINEATVSAPIYTAAETTNFIALASATLKALELGKTNEVVAKLTDLETAWDDKEDKFKPRDEKTWTHLDKTLDKAISALRSSHTNTEKGKTALESLIKQLRLATKIEKP